MAGTLTHEIFATSFLSKTNIKLDKNLFLLSSQGHDLLYFLNLTDMFKLDKAHDTSLILQEQNFDKLIINYTKLIIDNNNNNELKSFLYGYIIHHLLDSYTHPFIISLSGKFNKNDSLTFKYNGNHEKLESDIDMTLWKYFSLNKKIYKEFPKRLFISDTLFSVTEEAFYKTYNIENIGNTLINNLNKVNHFLFLYRSDLLGIKEFCYKLLDSLTKESSTKYTFLSFSSAKKFDVFKKVTWTNPVTKEKCVSSFMDLFDESLKESLSLINKIDESIKLKEIPNYLKNISAITGIKE
ncbi:MAG: zinc dependent phospholipase C family protein [Bacilli bacterium]